MARLGDQSGLITWSFYHRWPAYSIILGILGCVAGIMFGGLTGGLIGIVGGLVLGAFGGMLLGIDYAMFPVTLEKLVRYSGGMISFEGQYPARVRTIVISDDKGGFVEPRRIEYLQGMELRQLPPFSLPTWYKNERGRRLQVLQLDTFTFRPIIWSEGRMVVKNVPVYDEKTGEVRGEKDIIVLDTNFEIQEGKFVPISSGVAAKLDNERISYAEQVRLAYSMYQTGDFWQKYGHIIVAFLAIAATLTISIFGYIKFGDMAAKFSTDTATATQAVASSNAVAAQLNAQVATALLKAGFNVNTTFCGGGAAPSAPSTGGNKNEIILPIIGKVA